MQLSDNQQNKVEQFLLDTLPHGSGIDCKWEFEWLLNGKLKASNSYHCMNESGMYDGYADFSLTFSMLKSTVAFDFHFHGKQAQYKNRRYMLRDYLQDTVYYALEPHTNKSLYAIAIGE